jgi:hypothetical protein
MMRLSLEKLVPAILFLVLLLAFAWVFIGLRFDLWTPAEYARYRWLCSRMKITPDFWHGKIKAGDDARKIVRSWPPQVLHQFGPWAELEWIPFNPDQQHAVPDIGIEAVAKNARLVFARSYASDGVDEKIFFDAFTPATRMQYQAALQAFTWGELSPGSIPSKTARKPRSRKE